MGLATWLGLGSGSGSGLGSGSGSGSGSGFRVRVRVRVLALVGDQLARYLEHAPVTHVCRRGAGMWVRADVGACVCGEAGSWAGADAKPEGGAR